VDNAGAGEFGGEVVPVIGFEENRLRRSKPCAEAGPAAAKTASVLNSRRERDNFAILLTPENYPPLTLADMGCHMIAGPLTTPRHKPGLRLFSNPNSLELS
jgi:hypothetical protein